MEQNKNNNRERIDTIINNVNQYMNNELMVHGWIRTCRKQNEIIFFDINDGSEPKGLQVVCDALKYPDMFKQLNEMNINVGCYIKIKAILIESPAKGQDYELHIVDVIDYGVSDINTYPLKKNIKLDTLREKAHLRSRTKTFGCIYRIRNTVLYETHNFFQSRGFLNLDPNIITINECEGGAGVFTVSEMMNKSTRDIPNRNGIINYNKDHFKRQAYLTVSSQLQLEGLACGIGDVYTMNKSFRSEHSHTNKHVSEFTHLEIEMVDIDNNNLMDIGCDYIRYITKKVYDKNRDDIIELDKFISKGLLEKYNDYLDLTYTRVSYKDCIEILQMNGYNLNYGDDLSSECENFLTKYFKGAVFVYDWCYSIKSFYMKQKDDGTCENFDLLMPYGVGELIGGSMREDNYDKLVNGMRKKSVNEEGLEWYLELRKYGSVKHGGFGLGIDRLIMLLTGIPNIKDVIPYPVYFENCKF